MFKISRDIAEFWRRWHIALSTWFRDYVYIPLGGSRGSNWSKLRNCLIVFTVSGLWHGANWTFVVWGALNAAFFLPLLLLNRHRAHANDPAEGRLLPTGKEALQMAGTFCFVLACVVIEWVNRARQHALQFEPTRLPGFLRWALYYSVLVAICVYGGRQQPAFLGRVIQRLQNEGITVIDTVRLFNENKEGECLYFSDAPIGANVVFNSCLKNCCGPCSHLDKVDRAIRTRRHPVGEVLIGLLELASCGRVIAEPDIRVPRLHPDHPDPEPRAFG